MPQPEIKHKHKAGEKYGKLTLLKKTKKDKRGNWLWLCKCECGNKKIIRINNLIQGGSKSCGCLRKEHPGNMKHGLSRSRFYHIWSSMYGRCYRPYIGEAYHRYGEKGIDVCPKWQKFQGFIDDMYKSYQKHCEKYGEKQTTIDRLDNNKGYWPNNVKWSTYKEQANNTTMNRKNKIMFDIDGTKIDFASFLKKYNITPAYYWHRKHQGYSLQEIVNKYKRPSLKVQTFKEPLEKYFPQFSFLDDRQKSVIKMRFGLFGAKIKTLQKIGNMFNVSKERIRQIESKAIDTIFHHFPS